MTTKTKSDMDRRMDALEPGATIELSRNDDGVRVVAERSGNGKRLRILRETPNGFRVITDQPF